MLIIDKIIVPVAVRCRWWLHQRAVVVNLDFFIRYFVLWLSNVSFRAGCSSRSSGIVSWLDNFTFHSSTNTSLLNIQLLD